MKRVIFSTLCLMFSAAFVSAQTPQTIQPGFTVERELAETDKHNYEVNLTKGQMLNFTVEQRGIDVWLRIFTADGKFVDDFAFVEGPGEIHLVNAPSPGATASLAIGNEIVEKLLRAQGLL